MVSSENNATPLATTNEYSQLTLSCFRLAQSQIDLEIIEMTESIRALKTRRNEMSPISWIPPELLCSIFELVQQAGPGVPRYKRLSNLFGWTKITHVSHRWREIAIGNTSLWSNIIITGRWPEWEETTLIRSQKSPISVWVPTGTMELDYWKKLYVVEKVLLELSRITTLSIEGIFPIDLLRILSNSKLRPSTLLRSLKLSTFFREADGSRPTRTFKLFDDVLPSASGLSSLSLDGYGVNWTPNFFSSLVRLKIVNIPTSFRPSLYQVFSILKEAQYLESLTLSDFLPESGEDSRQNEIVHLPRLLKLQLIETSASAARFIPLLSYPDSANVTLDCEDVTHDELPILLSVFNRFPAFGTKRIRHLSLRESSNQDIHAWEDTEKGTESDATIRLLQFERPADITLSLSHMDMDEFPTTLMRACRIIPLQSLETLTFSPNITIVFQDWVYTFGHLEHLAWISLGVNSGIPLLSAILSSDNIILPSFRYLVIKHLGTNHDTSPIEVMEQAFAKRREQNVSIRILSLLDFTYLTPEHIQRLEQVVDSLKRDQYISPEQWSGGTS